MQKRTKDRLILALLVAIEASVTIGLFWYVYHTESSLSLSAFQRAIEGLHASAIDSLKSAYAYIGYTQPTVAWLAPATIYAIEAAFALLFFVYVRRAVNEKVKSI